MKICPKAVLELRLSKPSERYARMACKSNALDFAEALARVLPGCGAKVFHGSDGIHLRQAEGFIVTMGDDADAAVAAGAGRELMHVRGVR